MSPAVSIILPTYNRAHVLPRAVRSVVAQSFEDWELVAVDDGSQDGTDALFADYAARLGPRWRGVRQENAGASVARNRGLAEARGRWVAFLDSDDVWLPAKLSLQLATMTADGSGFCFTDYVFFDDDLAIASHELSIPADMEGMIYPSVLAIDHNFVMTPTVTLERDLALAAGGFDPAMEVCEDIDLWARVCRLARASLVRRPLVAVHLRTPDVFPYERGLIGRRELYERALMRDPDIGRLLERAVDMLYELFTRIAKERGDDNVAELLSRERQRLQREAWPTVMNGTVEALAGVSQSSGG
jgi:glycosyltransferase involved in cell wall biosynthesis